MFYVNSKSTTLILNHYKSCMKGALKIRFVNIIMTDLPDLGQCALYTVSSDDDSVPLVCAPALKQLSGEPALHHTRRRHHHAGADVIEVIHALEKHRHHVYRYSAAAQR